MHGLCILTENDRGEKQMGNSGSIFIYFVRVSDFWQILSLSLRMQKVEEPFWWPHSYSNGHKNAGCFLVRELSWITVLQSWPKMAISPLRTCISREHKCTYTYTCKSIPHNSLTDGCHYIQCGKCFHMSCSSILITLWNMLVKCYHCPYFILDQGEWVSVRERGCLKLGN